MINNAAMLHGWAFSGRPSGYSSSHNVHVSGHSKSPDISSSFPVMVPRLRRRCLCLRPSILNRYTPSPKDALLPHRNAEQPPCVFGTLWIKVSKLFARCLHALIKPTGARVLVTGHSKAHSKVPSSLNSSPSKKIEKKQWLDKDRLQLTAIE